MARHNILTWQQALQAGWQPRDYRYTGDLVPVGTYEVLLDFKIWAQKIMAVNCYCTTQHSAAKILLTVYCQEETGQYRLPNSSLDFATCPTGALYSVAVQADQKKRMQLVQAVLLVHP